MLDQDHEPRPLGRRLALPHTHALRVFVHAPRSGPVDRGSLRSAAFDAGRALSLSASARTLLGALVACYGEQEFAKGLFVWPSNAWLEDRTGLPERTLRSAILMLRHAGVVLTIDSANGKRYARMKGNHVVEAYGFDLSPLHARAADFAAIVAQADEARAELRARRNALSAIHKDLEDLAVALSQLGREDLAVGVWQAEHAARPPRSKFTRIEQLDILLIAAETARTEAERAYYLASRNEESAANDGENSRQKESNTESSIENCQKRSGENSPQLSDSAAGGGTFWASEEERGATVRDVEQTAEHSDRLQEESDAQNGKKLAALFDPRLWRTACPALLDYGRVAAMGDVTAAGRVMSRMLSLSPSGLTLWRERLGPTLFPLVAAYVYQLHADDVVRPSPQIRNLGGLFCTVAKEVADGCRDLSLDLMAMARKRRARSSLF